MMEFQQQDEELLLQIFPLEMWVIIFRHANAQDIQNCRLASRAFETLLHPIRAQHLFPEVLSLLVRYFPKNSNDLDGNIIFLRCRQVCRFWTTGVDQFLQDPIQNVCSGAEHLASNIRKLASLKYPISPSGSYGWKTPQQFENHFQTSHLAKGKNPFISRYLMILTAWDTDVYWWYYQQLEKILRQCGHYVWYLALIMYEVVPSGNYPEVRTLLQLMPNIKCLGVYHDSDGFIPARNQFLSDPFPILPHLEYLSVEEYRSDFFEAFLANNRHIKVLRLHEHRYSGKSFLFAKDMSNLEELEIRFWRTEDFQLMQNAQLCWPIKKLVLNLMWTKWEDVKIIFQALEHKFSTTLNDLKFTFPSQDYKVANSFSLCLPNLKTLTCKLPHPIPLDFILPMRGTLEHLSLDVTSTPEVGTVHFQETAIRFFSKTTVDDLTQSNIWQVFPKLKELKYGFNVGERHAWNTYKKVGPTNIVRVQAILERFGETS